MCWSTLTNHCWAPRGSSRLGDAQTPLLARAPVLGGGIRRRWPSQAGSSAQAPSPGLSWDKHQKRVTAVGPLPNCNARGAHLPCWGAVGGGVVPVQPRAPS